MAGGHTGGKFYFVIFVLYIYILQNSSFELGIINSAQLSCVVNPGALYESIKKFKIHLPYTVFRPVGIFIYI